MPVVKGQIRRDAACGLWSSLSKAMGNCTRAKVSLREIHHAERAPHS